MQEPSKCELCGEPMPAGEEMFKFHGYSGPCPKPPLQRWHVVTATCENGHKQTLKLDANAFSRAGAEQWSKLLDGSSKFYIHPPDEESVIGKCGICKSPFRCTALFDQTDQGDA